MALRWRSLGDFHCLILHRAGRSLVDQRPELGSPTSEAQPCHLAGAPRGCHPHGSEEKGEKKKERKKKIK